MTIRTFTILGVTGLTLLSAAAGYTADRLEVVADQMASDQVAGETVQAQDCMADRIEMPEGVVGCFTPVIAIIDESFFDSPDQLINEDEE